MEEEEGDEIDGLDDIDYDNLDPQILEIAEQMGIHPREVLKQIMQMNNEEGGEGEDDEEEGEDPNEMMMYGQEHHEEEPGFDQEAARLEQLRVEKERFKQQMGLVSDKKQQ